MKQKLIFVGVRNAFGLNDDPSGTFGFGYLHFDIAGSISALGAFFAHFYQCSHSALVSRSAGLNAFANPDFFFCESFVKKFVRFFFFGESFVSMTYKLIVGEFPGADAPPVEFQNSGGESADKSSVVANEKDGTWQTGENVF